MGLDRRSFLGGMLGGAAAAATREAGAKPTSPRDTFEQDKGIYEPTPPTLPPEPFDQMEREPHTEVAPDPFQSPKEKVPVTGIGNFLEVETEFAEYLDTDKEHFFFDPVAGRLFVRSLRNSPDAMPDYDITLDPKNLRLVRITVLPEGNGVHITIVTKDDIRQRIIVRRDFFGDHVVDVEDPTPLMNHPGEKIPI
jgi:hypothetical protein